MSHVVRVLQRKAYRCLLVRAHPRVSWSHAPNRPNREARSFRERDRGALSWMLRQRLDLTNNLMGEVVDMEASSEDLVVSRLAIVLSGGFRVEAKSEGVSSQQSFQGVRPFWRKSTDRRQISAAPGFLRGASDVSRFLSHCVMVFKSFGTRCG